jgi:hypothetical protein
LHLFVLAFWGLFILDKQVFDPSTSESKFLHAVHIPVMLFSIFFPKVLYFLVRCVLPFGGDYKFYRDLSMNDSENQILSVVSNMAGLRHPGRMTLGLSVHLKISSPSRHPPGTSRSDNCSGAD